MSGSKEPPHLPHVVDEAGESPAWLPILGLALLCALALALAARQAIGPSEEPAQPSAAADGGTAGAAEAPPAPPPSE